MDEWLLLLSHYGLFIVFLGAIFEGETVLVLAGILAHQGILSLPWVVSMAAGGAVVGDQAWFLSGRFYGEQILQRFPKLAQHAKKIEPVIKSKADWIAMGARFVYGTRTVSPVLLGSHGYPGLRFLIINTCSAGIWALLGGSIGFLAGAGAKRILGDTVHVEQILLVTFMVMIFLW